jgi:peptidyl-Asp metalloendopeptidase
LLLRRVTRLRPILLNLSAVDRAAAEQFSLQASPARAAAISVEAFSNATLTVEWNKTVQADKNGTVIWSGRVEGVPFGMATLVVNGSVATGSITRGDGFTYQIRTAADGTHWLLEIDQTRQPFRDDPLQPPRLAPGAVKMQAEASDDGGVIDLLVLYTAAARIGPGGTTQMHQLVDLAVAETNQAYANSGVTHRIRTAHVGEINYVESGDSGVDLTRLRMK